MSIDSLICGIQEENAQDLDREVVLILINEQYWERLKDERELGGKVQVMAVGPDEVQLCFCGIPVEFRKEVEYFSLETASRKTT